MNDNSVSWLDSSGDAYEGGISEDSTEEVVKGIDIWLVGNDRSQRLSTTTLPSFSTIFVLSIS